MINRAGGGKWAALASATLMLTVSFWAWSMLPPLATTYASLLSLSPFALSVLLATPVIVGSLGRIPLGVMADRFSGRTMLVAVCLLAAGATIFVGLSTNYSQLLVGAFCLGIAGASFAAGAPYVSNWFPKSKRGLALGLYALGNSGTAVSGLLTPRLNEHLGRLPTFILVSCLLAIAAAAMALWGRDARGRTPASHSLLSALRTALVWPYTRKLALMYGITFGAFVAFGVYLPVLLKIVYHLEVTDAAARAAGFVLLATLSRPLGGLLSDHFGGALIVRAAFIAIACLSMLVAFEPSLIPYGTAAYLSLATVLGLGNGAVFALLGHTCKPRLVGSVTGIVGAAGGLGGFFPPLVLGISLQLFHSYTLALLLLTASCLLILPATFGFSRFTAESTGS